MISRGPFAARKALGDKGFRFRAQKDRGEKSTLFFLTNESPTRQAHRQPFPCKGDGVVGPVRAPGWAGESGGRIQRASPTYPPHQLDKITLRSVGSVLPY